MRTALSISEKSPLVIPIIIPIINPIVAPPQIADFPAVKKLDTKANKPIIKKRLSIGTVFIITLKSTKKGGTPPEKTLPHPKVP